MEAALHHIGNRRLETRHGAFDLEVFHDLAARCALLVAIRGDVWSREPLLARIHGSCAAGECLCARDCRCAERLDAALAELAAHGRGALFYLMQEGRGASLGVRSRVRMMVQATRRQVTPDEAYDLIGVVTDLRRYESVASALRWLGCSAPLRLLSDGSLARKSLQGCGIEIAECVPLQLQPACASHGVAQGADAEPAGYFDPHPLPDAPRFVYMAAHGLSIGASDVAAAQNFRMHVYFDTQTLAERFVVSYGSLREPLVRIQPDALVDRISAGFAADAKGGWREVARRMVEHGAGFAIFLPPALEASRPALPDEASLALVAHHVKGRRARLLLDPPDAHVVQLDCADKLRRIGLGLEAPLLLEGVS
jgi:3,4-dihydroxy 2-butanone 4-phosphate synthase / GTP cyclohydrolase II